MGYLPLTVVGANGTMGRNVFAVFASFGHARETLEKITIQNMGKWV